MERVRSRHTGYPPATLVLTGTLPTRVTLIDSRNGVASWRVACQLNNDEPPQGAGAIAPMSSVVAPGLIFHQTMKGAAMTDSVSGGSDEAVRSAPGPSADLLTLDRLIGTWKVTGEAEGTVTYAWAEGGFFLFQHVELGGSKGLEVIGHDHKYGEEPSADIRSHYYGFGEGETLDYSYEVVDDTLTIWMGERGSPAYYEGTFSAAGTVLTGAWHYPGGGGYSTVTTKVTS